MSSLLNAPSVRKKNPSHHHASKKVDAFLNEQINPLDAEFKPRESEIHCSSARLCSENTIRDKLSISLPFQINSKEELEKIQNNETLSLFLHHAGRRFLTIFQTFSI